MVVSLLRGPFRLYQTRLLSLNRKTELSRFEANMTKADDCGSRDPLQSFAIPEDLQTIDASWRNFVLSYRCHENDENPLALPPVRAAFFLFAHELAKDRLLLDLLVQSFERNLQQAGALPFMPAHMQEYNDALRRFWLPMRQIWRWWRL
jgi:hypothetical protein